MTRRSGSLAFSTLEPSGVVLASADISSHAADSHGCAKHPGISSHVTNVTLALATACKKSSRAISGVRNLQFRAVNGIIVGSFAITSIMRFVAGASSQYMALTSIASHPDLYIF
jgi:hypothetical protein